MKEVFDSIHLGTRGDALDLNGELDQHDIHHVISLSYRPVPATTVHHPLIDGYNDQPDFDVAVDAVRSALSRSDNTLVHCRAARSRSVAVLATAIASETEAALDTALAQLEDEWERTDPKTPLLKHGRQYLGTSNSESTSPAES